MKKNDKLSEGLSNLLGARNETKERFTTTEAGNTQSVEATADEPTKPETDIINTIEDEELKEALKKHRLRKAGRPRKDAKDRMADGEKYTRFTTIVNREQIAKLKEIGFRETLTLKEILEQIIGDAIEVYESRKGKVVPQTHKGDPSKLFK